MTIHLHDSDPRLHIEGLDTFRLNCSAFSTIHINLNEQLQKMGLHDAKNADIVGHSTSLDIDFGFQDRKRFCIGVWETTQIPYFLVGNRRRLESTGKFLYFGLSKQVDDIWKPYGFENTPVVDLGCDTEFWKPQPVEKFEKFTILCTAAATFRSGVPNLIMAFVKAFDKNPNMQLIIKNVESNAQKLPTIIYELVNKGYDIKYICQRQNVNELRDLMARCHLMVYPVINTSGGIPILEASAMEMPVLVGDFCPVNLYPHCGTIKVHNTMLSQLKQHLLGDWGLPYYFLSSWIDESQALMYDLDIKDLAERILDVANNYGTYQDKAKECRQSVINNWSWHRSMQQLLTNLKKYE